MDQGRSAYIDFFTCLVSNELNLIQLIAFLRLLALRSFAHSNDIALLRCQHVRQRHEALKHGIGMEHQGFDPAGKYPAHQLYAQPLAGEIVVKPMLAGRLVLFVFPRRLVP